MAEANNVDGAAAENLTPFIAQGGLDPDIPPVLIRTPGQRLYKGEQPMPAEESKSVVRRYIEEVWTKRNLAAVDAFLAPHYRRHVSPTATPLTLDGQKQRLAAFRAAFPDMELTVEDMLAEGDRVAFRSTIRGTHGGVFLGIPASGKRVTVSLVDIVRVEHGRIVEHWGGPDIFDLLQQLGAGVSPVR